MLNFTVGPVMSGEVVLSVGAEQVPYFRTPEFSATMFENAELIKKFAAASETDKVVFITGSGTASMEATVINCFTAEDRLLVINGGSFGQRFADICKIHGIPHTEIKLGCGQALCREQLYQYNGQGYSGLLVNMCETSTGVLYDLPMISTFCKENNCFLVVDAISAFLADPVDFNGWGIDVLITGSQKALACPPGISIIVMSQRAEARVRAINVKCMYLNLVSALDNMQRGQTPFTPAVGILRQINARLKEIDANGGAQYETDKVSRLAKDFRSKIAALPFEIASQSLSNAVTPLHPLNVSAYDVFTILKDEYSIWICPNGGALKDSVFRVGHIGALTYADNDKLIAALNDLKCRGLLQR